VIYARSDIVAITVSEAHGGCGQLHERPEGERAWGLVCAQCEGFLRTDPNWSGKRDEIPETFDERSARDALERNAGRSQLRAIEAGAGLLAALLGPRDLLAGQPLALAAAPAGECRRCGAGVQAGAKFCPDCGSPVLTEVA
jgi:zinc ribbon protein